MMKSSGSAAALATALCLLAGASCSRQPRPRPSAVVAFTGSMLGHMEPCGCSANETGGLPRRHSYFRALADQFGSVVAIDNGDLVPGASPQHQIKMEFLASGLDRMGYVAVNLGERDVAFGMDYLRGLVGALEGELALLSANLLPVDEAASLEDVDWPCKPFVIRQVTMGGQSRRVAIAGVMSERFAPTVAQLASEARVAPPARVLPGLLRQLEAQSDFVILLAQTTSVEAVALAKAAPGVDVIVCGHRRHVPAKVEHEAARPRIFESGSMGRYVATLELTVDSAGQLTSGDLEFEIIDKGYARAPVMEELILEYRSVLKGEDLLGRIAREAGLPRGGAYIGNMACGACHEEDLTIWRRSRHAQAYLTLARLKQNKELDPECVTCHVIGLGFQTGFVSWQRTPDLANVGCESCHGAGLRHAEDPSKPYNKSSREFCRTCHNADHSTDFDYERDLPSTKHGMQKVGRKRKPVSARIRK